LHERTAAGIGQKGVAAEEEPPALEVGKLLGSGAAVRSEEIEDRPEVNLVELAGGAADLPAVEAPASSRPPRASLPVAP